MARMHKKTNFISSIDDLIADLDGPDYITHKYESVGISSLVILSGVFRADKSYLGNYLAGYLHKNKKLYKNKNVLDLGCGCGLLGLICSLNGAKRLYMSDVNPTAIKNSKMNCLLYDKDNVDFITSDLYTNHNHKSKYDLIIFNPPSIPGRVKKVSNYALIKRDNLLEDFFVLSHNYLAKNGIIILPGSTRFEKPSLFIDLAKKYKYSYSMINVENEDAGYYKFISIIKSKHVKQ